MPGAHRNTDNRSCGAETVSTQSRNVYVNGLLWAINGDPDSHGGGDLIASQSTVFIGGVAVIVQGDQASPDNLCPHPGGSHCDPQAVGCSTNVFIG